ncbi:hypothetical protein [Lentzea sp. NBRC 105346]|uniref:hypothetical protein n=1 Tax=Lentzea sp. NBRC 105346 TaxID=3032205 RepID=UPI002557ADC0|nr:hypothetical protein [Lentzea sp. NBRC 105346]
MSPTEDELDKDQLDQLHAATLKASDACFEMKKLCATVLVPTGTLVALLSDRILNAAVFVAAIAVVITFWMADSVAYYYQRRLRNVMDTIWSRRAQRCNDYPHVPAAKHIRPLRALFNGSMSYYFVLLLVLAVAFALYGMGVIAPVGRISP